MNEFRAATICFFLLLGIAYALTQVVERAIQLCGDDSLHSVLLGCPHK